MSLTHPIPTRRLAVGLTVLGLTLAPLAGAQSLDSSGAEDSFFQAYYLQHEQGDLEAALKIYKAIAGDSSAPKSVRVQAKKFGTACWEELACSDFARLVPEDTIAYLEINRPGQQLAGLLDQLGLLQGSEGSGDIAISPLLIKGLLGVRGAAVAVTHVDPTGGPPNGVVILHPGDMDIIRGLIETALPAGGQRVDAIDGHDTWNIEGHVFVTMTERLVLASPDPSQISGVLTRLGNGGKGSLAENPDLAATLAMRGSDLAFFCVNAEPVMPQIQAMLGAMAQHEPQMAMALQLCDVGSLQAIAGRLGVDENGISFDIGLQLAEDHNNVFFNLLRMPHVTRRTLGLVPAGTAFFMASTLNEPAQVAPGATNSRGEPVVSLMDFGREFFGNVVDVAIYAMPGTTSVQGEQIPDVALALTVNDPARSRAIWNLVLGLAKGATGGGNMQPKVLKVAGNVVELYDIEGVGLYVMTAGNTIVLTPSENALKAAVAASRGENVLQDELYRGALAAMNESQTMALAFSPGRGTEIAKAYMSEREMREVAPILAMLGQTVVSVTVEHSATTMGLSARVDGLPKVGGMVSQLVARELRGGGMRHERSASVVVAMPAEPEAPAPVDVRTHFEAAVGAGQHAHARGLVEEVAEGIGEDAMELNNFAWYLLTEDRYAGRYDDLALPIARRANELSEWGNWYYLDTLAHALNANGEFAEAVKVQSLAVKIAESQGDAQAGEAAATLASFKQAAEAEDR
jgi:hypothetical protein